MANKKAFWGRVAIFATTLIWGTSFVILKNTLDNIGTFWIMAIRFTVSALLLGLAANRKLFKMDKQVFRGSVLMGLCLAVAYIVQTYGLKYTTPGKNAFLTATYCVLVPFMAWGIYKRKPTGANIIAALLCITGIGFVSLGDVSGGMNVGDVLTLCCGVFYGLQIIMMEQYAGKCDALSISTVQFAAAALACWVGALIFEQPPQNLPGSAWMSIAYLSIMCTAVCFFLQAWGMKYTPSSTTAVIMTLESVFGTLISIVFYHERMTFKLVLGFALIFVSVLISETGGSFLKKKKRRNEQKMDANYGDREFQIVESGIDKIKAVLLGNDTKAKERLLFYLDWYLDPYYKNEISVSDKEEIARVLQRVVIEPNEDDVIEEAIHLLDMYLLGTFEILEDNFSLIPPKFQPDVLRSINEYNDLTK